MKINTNLILLAFFYVISTTAYSQETQEIIDKIQAIKKKKLIEKLNLSKDKSDEFLKIYDSYMSKDMSLNKEKRSVFKKLSHMSALGDDISSDKILNTVDELNNLDRAIQKNYEDNLGQLKESLTPAQLARFIVFENRFQYKLRDLLIDIRRKKGRIQQYENPFDEPIE
ncbi:hypothetical protein K1X84_05425 [bacterium]|nr:hypothetical protein [bacterium]